MCTAILSVGMAITGMCGCPSEAALTLVKAGQPAVTIIVANSVAVELTALGTLATQGFLSPQADAELANTVTIAVNENTPFGVNRYTRLA